MRSAAGGSSATSGLPGLSLSPRPAPAAPGRTRPWGCAPGVGDEGHWGVGTGGPLLLQACGAGVEGRGGVVVEWGPPRTFLRTLPAGIIHSLLLLLILLQSSHLFPFPFDFFFIIVKFRNYEPLKQANKWLRLRSFQSTRNHPSKGRWTNLGGNPPRPALTYSPWLWF